MSIELDAAAAHAADLQAIASEYPAQSWFESEFGLAEGEGFEMAYVGASLENNADVAWDKADSMAAETTIDADSDGLEIAL
jgi:hypothetical protein